MVGLIATTLLAGARMPAGATSNMKRKIPRDAADRIAVAGPERDVRNLVPFLRMEKCFFLTSPFIEPLLILHGTPDVNVPYLESVRLIDEALKKGKGDLVTFMMYPGEFHYFSRAHVLRDAWHRVDDFFALHLRGDLSRGH